MPNIDLLPYSRPSMWRKMSLANWRHPTDPQVYGNQEIDMHAAMLYAGQLTQSTGVKVTATHMVVRAVALALSRYPDANSIIRLARIYRRRDVNIFCQVAIPGEKPDLSGTVIRKVDTKSPAQIARELSEQAGAVRRGEDRVVARTRRTLDVIPTVLSRVVFEAIGFLQYDLNLDLRALGLPKDPFGSAMVTSVGSLGISHAWAPLVPMRVPIVVALGKVEDKPVVRDGEVVIRPVCTIGATFDHRIMDGLLAGKLSEAVTEYLADPAAYE
jgi:pyruvate/2-oxoglutarate dehydrogenase complex dihydrolipoamide acyltransferase (E2) component